MVAGYTDEENPFGDTQLTQQFVWHKKGGGKRKGAEALRAEQEERLREIEKVRQRRKEREEEKIALEEEQNLLARERAAAEYAGYEVKEAEFHRQQIKVRSELRVKDGRATPVDVLAKNLHLAPEVPFRLKRALS